MWTEDVHKHGKNIDPFKSEMDALPVLSIWDTVFTDSVAVVHTKPFYDCFLQLPRAGFAGCVKVHKWPPTFVDILKRLIHIYQKKPLWLKQFMDDITYKVFFGRGTCINIK